MQANGRRRVRRAKRETEEEVRSKEGGKRGGVREGRAPSYRLMVCSRIGLVDRRLNWVSVQSPANTSSTDSPVCARGYQTDRRPGSAVG